MKLKESVPYPNPEKLLTTFQGWDKLGSSVGMRDIVYKKFGKAIRPGKILLIGGVHGNETEGVAFTLGLAHDLERKEVNFDQDIILVPIANPDGFVQYRRQNKNNVDLNRNMPTKDWTAEAIKPKYSPGISPNSEPETQALIKVINQFKPNLIISFHSWKPMININGPAEDYGNIIHEHLGYVVSEDIGYPTPGSLGTYTGWERSIPTITLEFERGMKLEDVYPFSKKAIFATIDFTSKQV